MMVIFLLQIIEHIFYCSRKSTPTLVCNFNFINFHNRYLSMVLRGSHSLAYSRVDSVRFSWYSPRKRYVFSHSRLRPKVRLTREQKPYNTIEGFVNLCIKSHFFFFLLFTLLKKTNKKKLTQYCLGKTWLGQFF